MTTSDNDLSGPHRSIPQISQRERFAAELFDPLVGPLPGTR